MGNTLNLLTFDELWAKLVVSDESVNIEVKRGREVGLSALETVSAFSNEPGSGGGYLIFGVLEHNAPRDMMERRFEVEGVADVDKLQLQLATRCRNDMEPPVNPRVETYQFHGKNIVVAFVPEVDSHQKPVHVKSKGLHAGSFRRIGSADVRCTRDDLETFITERKGTSYDSSFVAGMELDDFDTRAVSEYRRLRHAVNPDAPELEADDTELLRALAAVRRDDSDGQLKPTLAGLVLFGKALALRRLSPMLRVDYIRVEGKEWVSDPDERYHAVEYLEPLLTSIPRLVAQAFDDLPKAFSLSDDSLFRKDIPAIPRTVLREAIVNAVMHRNYRIRQPIQIIRYSNRIEIRSPGFSLIPEERLGEPGSRTRNDHIAQVLHELHLAENKGTGIRTMRRLMHEANLSRPAFSSDRLRDEFAVTLLAHHFLGEDDIQWLSRFKSDNLNDSDRKALVVMRETGYLNNALYRDTNNVDMLEASRGLRRLRDCGLVNQREQGPATYYVPSPRFLHPVDAADSPNKRADSPNKGTDSPNKREDPASTAAAPRGLLELGEAEKTEIRALVRELTERIGSRSKQEEVRKLIVLLCAIQPRTLRELGPLLSRKSLSGIRDNYLTPMVRDQILAFTHPEEINHPQQMYTLGPQWRTSAGME